MIYQAKKTCVLEWLNYRVELEPGNFVRGEKIVKGWLKLDGRRIILDDAGLEAALSVEGLLEPIGQPGKKKSGKANN